MLEMMAANFFYNDPKTKSPTPLDVYIGNLGPLRLRIYNHSPLAMDGRFDPTMPFIPVPHIPGHPNAPILDAKMTDSVSSDVVLSLPARHLHMMIVVELPPITDILQALQEDALPVNGERPARDSHGARATIGRDIQGRSLPLLFIRSYDGVGYHSGRVITAENVLQTMEISEAARPPGAGPEWLAHMTAAQAAARFPGDDDNGWSLKVL